MGGGRKVGAIGDDSHRSPGHIAAAAGAAVVVVELMMHEGNPRYLAQGLKTHDDSHQPHSILVPCDNPPRFWIQPMHWSFYLRVESCLGKSIRFVENERAVEAAGMKVGERRRRFLQNGCYEYLGNRAVVLGFPSLEEDDDPTQSRCWRYHCRQCDDSRAGRPDIQSRGPVDSTVVHPRVSSVDP